MNKSTLRLLLALVLAALAAPAWAAGEAKMYVITDWELGNLMVPGFCSGKSIPDWDDMVDGWYNSIDDLGIFVKDGRQVNGTFTRSLLCDPDAIAGCTDNTRLDDADVAMIGLHGGDSGKHWRGSLRQDGTPSASADCRIDAAEASGGEMFVGDTDLEYLHLSSCHSMDDDNLSNTRYWFQDPVDSPGNGQRLHMATGFHGIMWISSGRDDDYEDFGWGGHMLLGSIWMDEMYDSGVNGEYEQCPVAYSVGPSLDNCVHRLTTEGYMNLDPTLQADPTSINYWCVQYYDGCDPKNESPFSLP
ncbi:MAG TPA: DUF6345 domain-containing protein [Thermoanaerobaculia bacterium]|nr:DUF6345 domain-containing protein [Thermoanaerobaculia bacterium]